ncbi:hypothetical protein NDU88_004866 [Pleurodeles waltl]|uniref:Uncharacterized protein n=1 Tax=Pleurodeles waltl TaxID=8319 RepID=A0AAV7LL96_PLEWA|nr:hypothetical protein NDU88_004866 [Pleurodeles waltl]
MASFDDNRDLLAAELFSKKPHTTHTTNSTPPKEGLRQKFIKLERLRKQELARWWDITTLKRYLELKQIPRGLRVIIFPSFEDLDPDLLGEWEHLISSTSFSMINILIKHADRKRSKLLLDIASLEEEIKGLNLTEATDKNYAIMKEILNGYQLYVKDKKMRKLIRDENDYSKGRIYTFARKFDLVNRDTHNTQTSLATLTESASGSLSDISNLSSDCADAPMLRDPQLLARTLLGPHNTRLHCIPLMGSIEIDYAISSLEAVAADKERSVSYGPAREGRERSECAAAEGGSQQGEIGLGSGSFPPLPPHPFYRGRVEASATAPAPQHLGVPPRPLLHGGSPAEAWGLRAGPTDLQLRDNNQDGLCPRAGEGALRSASVGASGRGGDIRGIRKPGPWTPDRHHMKILSPSWRLGRGVYRGIGGGVREQPPSLLAPASGVPLPPPPLQPEAKTACRGHTGGHTSGDASGRCALYS